MNRVGDKRLVRETGLQILSTWYNYRRDLGTYDSYGQPGGKRDQTYAANKAIHLITWHPGKDPGPDQQPTTDDRVWQTTEKYGTICGATYPMSAEFLPDMARLARNLAGRADGPPLYVSLFTEFTTYTCPHLAGQVNHPDWRAYHTQLKRVFLEARDVFKANAPNALVALNWLGSDITFDVGRAQIPFFKDAMDRADFQSTQAMSNHENIEQTIAMATELKKYGNGRVMQAHYKVDNSNQSVFASDMNALFTDRNIQRLKDAGVFAWSFLDAEELIGGNETRYQQIKNGILKYQIKAPPWPLK